MLKYITFCLFLLLLFLFKLTKFLSGPDRIMIRLDQNLIWNRPLTGSKPDWIWMKSDQKIVIKPD